MNNTFASETEKLFRNEIKNIHGFLLAHRIRDKEVAQWLGCTPQNVNNHWQDYNFTARQMFIIQRNIDLIKQDVA